MKNILILFLGIILLASCKKDKLNSKSIIKFTFTKANNPILKEDVEGIITGNEIKVVLHGIPKNNLKPTIIYQSKTIDYKTDYTQPVLYTLEAEDGTTSNYTVNVESRDIYFAGNDFSSNLCYWKNGVKTVIDNDPTTFVKGIVVNGNDVYVAGVINYNRSNQTAVYWKNGIKVNLRPTSPKSSLTDIVLHNNDIYITGSIVDENTGITNAVYWKNGVMTKLDNASSSASSIYISGNDVYVSGNVTNAGKSTAIYWKNGSKVILDNSVFNSNTTSLTLVNNDIYVFGNYTNTHFVSCYWKNGILTSFPINDIIFKGIGIDNEIHMFGETYLPSAASPTTAYWKNNEKIILDDGTPISSTIAATSLGKDIYILGGYTDWVLWINGKRTNYINFEGEFQAMYIKSN